MIRKHATHLTNTVRFSDTIDIVAAPDATAIARIFMKRTLQWWQAPQVVDDMLTVGTELVTNASAPRGVPSYPRYSREELKGGSWA
ncbi:hypothetical protein OHR68_14100 [Spirillospora sp. NBC_00431]